MNLKMCITETMMYTGSGILSPVETENPFIHDGNVV